MIGDSFQIIEKPIFIVGPPRCGTTLLARILNLHPDVFIPGETHYMPDIYSRRDSIGDLGLEASRAKVIERLKTIYDRFNEAADQDRVDLLFDNHQLSERLNVVATSHRAALAAFLQAQMELEGKKRWGNNVPKDLFYIDDLLELFPDALIIMCARDPRAFLDSYRHKWRVTRDTEADRLKALYHPITTSLLWNTSIRAMRSWQSLFDSGQGLRVLYEDLVTDSEWVVQEICNFAGLTWAPEMLDISFSNSSVSGQPKNGIYGSSVDKWKEDLSVEDLYIVQRFAADGMRFLDIDPVPTKPSFVKLAGIFASFPFAVIRALYANRHNRGPLLPYVFKRVRMMRVG